MGTATWPEGPKYSQPRVGRRAARPTLGQDVPFVYTLKGFHRDSPIMYPFQGIAKRGRRCAPASPRFASAKPGLWVYRPFRPIQRLDAAAALPRSGCAHPFAPGRAPPLAIFYVCSDQFHPFFFHGAAYQRGSPQNNSGRQMGRVDCYLSLVI